MISVPNIIFINCHDLGQHLRCYGINSVSTPHLDLLASEGVLFRSSFCCAPQCSPSRAATFTGRYPHANGVMGLVQKNFRWDLHEEERHLAAILRDAGYRTALIGHQHETRTPEVRGWGETSAEMDDDEIAPAAVECLRRLTAAPGPFYLQVGFHRPHRHDSPSGYRSEQDREFGVSVPPYLVDEPSAREDLAAFQGDVRLLDHHVGQILQALERSGKREDTWVIFNTDHGIPYPRAKCSLYDPGLEVALIMRWPAGFQGGRIESGLISNLDYLPTILDFLGLAPADNLHGRSFAALLRQTPGFVARREIFAEMTYHTYYDPRRCIRTPEYKLILNFSTSPFFMDPSQQWRPKTVTIDPADPARAFHVPLELYDLTADPREFVNLGQHPAFAKIREDLLRRLHGWMQTTADPLLKGPPPSPMHDLAIQLLDAN